MKVFLATTSKFKSDIMNTVKLNHYLIKSNFKEYSNKKDVYEYVKELSLGKANSVLNKVTEGIIIGLDTVVYTNNTILEKPKDIEEAKEFIKMCSDNITRVITGLTIINKKTNETINEYVETKVILRDINDIDIDYYINNEPNIMYSSGFVIETIISNFIEKIEGSYYNILGIPVETIYKYINSWGYNLIDLEGN